jgi:hypothetical protein
MRHLRFSIAPALAVGLAMLPACTEGTGMPMRHDSGMNPIIDGGFVCLELQSEACLNDVHFSCEPEGEFLRPVRDDCAARGLVCHPAIWCVVCHPGERSCDGDGNVITCRDDGSGWDVTQECNIAGGEVCVSGACVNLCNMALDEQSYVGCEFYAVDLDNAAIGAGRDAASQQYAIVVSNPGQYPSTVVVELDTGAFGAESTPVIVDTARLLPGDLEVFELPRREVDGSSSFAPCSMDSECQSATQQCWCAGGVRPDIVGADDCRCRNGPLGGPLNDGTHSALTSHAYRVRSDLPIIAYQFNPLDNVGVFSNDASLLLPTSAIDERYTVVGWPQTIANSSLPSEDFDPSATDEDLRAFLTIVGTEADTHVTVTLGPQVREVEAVGPYPTGIAMDVWEFDVGAFDVINLETHGFNADFTGTTVVGDRPVSVFTGSEASDAPRFTDIANRRCCADHLEEQLFPDSTLGFEFYIGRTPTRSHALNLAFLDPLDSVGEFNEPEYVRIVATWEGGLTHVLTSMPFPDDTFDIAEGDSVIIEATQDMHIVADHNVAVLQVTPSQEATGIPTEYPGGDPDIIAVPPVNQWREEYVFLTPSLYAFDFVTLVAHRDTRILMDEQPIESFDCQVGPADGLLYNPGDPPPEYLSYRCQLSFPDVLGRPTRVEPGIQDDGYHTIRTLTTRMDVARGCSLVITGFDSFVSYGYVGGANLIPIE